MIEIGRLRGEVSDGRAAFDVNGAPLAHEPRLGQSPAALLVVPVTDALKQITDEGMIVSSIERDSVVEVVGFSLASEVLAVLPDEVSDGAGLLQAVENVGFEWLISPTSDPGAPNR